MQELIDCLQSIADGTAKVNRCPGLCTLVRRLHPDYLNKFNWSMMTVCDTWEHFSGDYKFPINHPDFTFPEDGFSHADFNNKMYEGEYGRRRRELAGLVAEELRKCKS